MTIDRSVMAFAGILISSLLLEQLYGQVWLWLTAFIGLNLIQRPSQDSSRRDGLQAFGVKPGRAFS